MMRHATREERANRTRVLFRPALTQHDSPPVVAATLRVLPPFLPPRAPPKNTRRQADPDLRDVTRIARTIEEIANVLRSRGVVTPSGVHVDPLGNWVRRLIAEQVARHDVG